MQTFVPYKAIYKNAECLDDRRLGKQRVEAKQILRCLCGVTDGWKYHPAVKMWQGYEGCLAYYGYHTCWEWRQRGFKDSLMPEFVEFIYIVKASLEKPFERPPWWGGKIHKTHQANLVRKDPEFYGPLFPNVDPSMPYYWPV